MAIEIINLKEYFLERLTTSSFMFGTGMLGGLDLLIQLRIGLKTPLALRLESTQVWNFSCATLRRKIVTSMRGGTANRG
ncbi:MAG: hypothetical protein ACLPXB_07695 [Thiobacillaceae bacterium]